MLNKKFILILVCVLTSLLIYAESGTITSGESKNPHHEFTIKADGKQNRYRIQMCVSHYAYYIDAESCSQCECFPNYEMGISREEGGANYKYPNYNALSIFPEIVFKDESLKDVFSVKGISRVEAGYNYNCYVTDWEIYEKGLVLDVIKTLDRQGEQTKIYLELKDDGKYYETENAERFGRLTKSYSAYDFLDRTIQKIYSHSFIFFGYSIYKMGSGKNIESVLISNILAYNTTEDGIEFITPYGCGFFDFQTESMSLVPKEKYLGREFTYSPYNKDWYWKIKEKRKMITESDLNPPDIKIPLMDNDLDYYSNRKQVEKEQKEQDQLLKAELLAK